MPRIKVFFEYITGITRKAFTNVYLWGSWNKEGYYSKQWSESEMEFYVHPDGSCAYKTFIEFDESQVGWDFHWGVFIDSSQYKHTWGIPREIKRTDSSKRFLTFKLKESGQEESYYLSHYRRLGANKYYDNSGEDAGLRITVWAPNAAGVDLVFGNKASGYISDSGEGIDPEYGTIGMENREEGIWTVDERNEPRFKNFEAFEGAPYMFKITRQDGTETYRTDIYSRKQIGGGHINPRGKKYTGKTSKLDGSVSCSVVVDPDKVVHGDLPLTLPKSINELIIYELHVGALNYGKPEAGNLDNAIELIPHLTELGVTAVELMPISEFAGDVNWGYATSHYMAVEQSAGGRDKLREFIKLCHESGMLVILDVVYNHYIHEAERVQWKYDSNNEEDNLYYWFEGKAFDYPFDEERKGHHGGYIDNGSSGYAPRYHEEMVRKMFISSAVMYMEEFRVDGFRFDAASAIHNSNKLHYNGQLISAVNAFGTKFLREINRTLKLLNKNIILIAEDYSYWDKLTKPIDFNNENDDALGFDAEWNEIFYHNLIGDTKYNSLTYARLLYEAGFGENWPLKMDIFASQGLIRSNGKQIVYHESHDEVGNMEHAPSMRTIEVASHYNLDEKYIEYAESRSRFVAGMSILSAGIPMFFMFEEVGARKKYDHANFIHHREDYKALKAGEGKKLFLFYKDLIAFRKKHTAIQSDNIDLLHVHNDNRVIAFRRWDESGEFIVAGSLNNHSFNLGYIISHPHIFRCYKEIFNSDSAVYGGDDMSNGPQNIIMPENHSLSIILPANGFIILKQVDCEQEKNEKSEL